MTEKSISGMTVGDHRKAAEAWLITADDWAARAGGGVPDWAAVSAATARAQVHATLALSAQHVPGPLGDPYGIAP